MEDKIFYLLIINIVLEIALFVIIITLLRRNSATLSAKQIADILREESRSQQNSIGAIISTANVSVLRAVEMNTVSQQGNIEQIVKMLNNNSAGLESRQEIFVKSVESRLDSMRITTERTLSELRKDNAEQLEKMRMVVDEKLQSTLNERLNQSFNLISERLEKVHEGLNEMRNLTAGVTDLKKVLNGVKTRGVWGEVSLGNLLEQILVPEQYCVNAAIGRGREVVEYAIVLPGKESGKVLLPIDSKFPMEDYQKLVEASENADKEQVEVLSAALERRIKDEAKSICDKYIKPPFTTDFAVLYLPLEGLFAEVVRRSGLQEFLHTKYRVLLTGPTTLASLLNSLQIGFKTVAIEKRSREIWQLLSAFKHEFVKFSELLDKTQKYMDQASDGIRNASGRTLAIQKKLSRVELIEEPDEVPADND